MKEPAARLACQLGAAFIQAALRSAGRRCAHQLHVVRRSSLRRSSLVMDIVQERSMIGSRHAFGRAHTSVPHSSLVTSSGCSLQILQIQMSRDA